MATPSNQAGQASTAAAGVLVILGASGDLTKRLLMPALYNLACEGLLPDEFAVVGMALTDLTTAEFRAGQRHDIARFTTRKTFDEDCWRWLESRLHYTPGNFADPVAYDRLMKLVLEVGQATGAAGNTLIYLAISPDFFAAVNQHLDAAGFTPAAYWPRTQSRATAAGSSSRTASRSRDFPSRIAAGSSDVGGSMQT